VLIFFDTIINVIIEKEEMEMSSPIKPLADRVVAVREKAQEKTASGLYLPDSSKEKDHIKILEESNKQYKKG